MEISYHDSNTLSSFPERLKPKIEEKTTYIELLQSIEIEDTEKLVEASLRNATSEKRAQRNRNDRSRSSRLGKKALAPLKNAEGFLRVFSGVMEIVKGIDPRIGGIAYGMVSLLTSLGNNIQLQNDLAEKALETMTQWFDRVKRVVEIHSDIEDNRELFAGMEGVYSEALRILASVTRHYMRPGWKVLILAIGKPPQVHLQPMLETFKETVANFMVEHEILQASRFKALLQQHDQEMQQHNQERETKRMQNLAKWLKLSANSGDIRQRMIKTSQESHLTMRSHIRLGGGQQTQRRLTQAKLDLLRNRDSYQKWNESQKSTFLLLSGENRASDLTDTCWLSPLATEVLETLPESASFLFISSPLKEGPVPVSREALFLKVLLYQLLSYNESLYDTLLATPEIHQKVQQISSSPANGDDDDSAEVIFESIRMILKQVPIDSIIYIIVDGIVLDQVPDLRDRWAPLGCVARLVCDLDLEATIKCLAIADSRWWTGLEDQCGEIASEQSRKLARELGLSPSQYPRLLTELKWKQEIAEGTGPEF